jgi:ribosomal 50S subunit-associated protein YjgA (DUF615 family)
MKKPTPDDPEETEGRGRSARRREALSFEAMAEDLVALPAHRCKGLPVTARLKEALDIARDTTAKVARRRHLRHLASLLRESPLEVEAMQAFLAGKAYVAVRGDEEYRDLAALREGLCTSVSYQETLDLVCQTLPQIDLLHLSRLVDQWHESRDDKTYRAIYKELHRAQEDQEAQDE